MDTHLACWEFHEFEGRSLVQSFLSCGFGRCEFGESEGPICSARGGAGHQSVVMACLRVAWRTALFLTWKVYEEPDRSVVSKALTKIQGR
jgi:hypothetical protein